jgi:hypothetical protein
MERKCAGEVEYSPYPSLKGTSLWSVDVLIGEKEQEIRNLTREGTAPACGASMSSSARKEQEIKTLPNPTYTKYSTKKS